MSLYAVYDMQYCDRCHGQRPHSKKGNCLASHRTTQLATVTPIKRTALASFAAVHTKKPTAPKPRRSFDQAKVKAAIAGLLGGVLSLQQACRDADCDTEYLHRKAWAAAKAAVNKRDDGRCQYPDCNTDAWIKDAHHRITKGSGGSSNPLVAYYLPNLITLCRTHHTYVTDNPNAGEKLGLVIPRLPGVDPATVPAHTIHGLVLLTPDGSRTAVNPPDQEAS